MAEPVQLLAGAASPALLEARVDAWGPAGPGQGTLLVGWLPEGEARRLGAERAILHCRSGSLGSMVALCLAGPVARDGAPGVAVLALASAAVAGNDLVAIDLWGDGAPLRFAADDAPRLDAPDVRALARTLLPDVAEDAPHRARLQAALEEPAPAAATPAVEELSKLALCLRIELEEAFFLPPDGLALLGWLVDPTQGIAAIRLCSGTRVTPLTPERRLAIRRRDILEQLATAHGLDDPHLGFLFHFPQALTPGAPVELEIETRAGQFARVTVPTPRSAPLAAIRRVLGAVELPHGAVAPVFDAVLGPVVLGLNRLRLQHPAGFEELAFGLQPRRPAASIIVPLYGRLDFMAYQVALFSEAGLPGIELLYVLDDPRQRREAEQLAASLHARFGLAFRLLACERNLGFAPAVNLGVRASRGEHLCILNSDVFPGSPDWLPRLILHLQADHGLGMVAPVLLFEDGTLQHAGCRFLPRQEYGGWPFPHHEGKGRTAPAAAGLIEAEALSGACLVLSRTVWNDVGGFDEDYVLGDFEDADLCLKLTSRGLRCAVDTGVSLYHLERQSQAKSGRWRQQLTVFNAWRFHRRWHRHLALRAERSARPLP